MSVADNIAKFEAELAGTSSKLVAVSKTKPSEVIMEAYQAGFRRFGENRVQELIGKYQELPKDIEWHMIGHLQRNKVKYIASFVSLIQGVDNLKLLWEINKQGKQLQRTIPCLLQVFIAQEESKFGFEPQDLKDLVEQGAFNDLTHVQILGLMGMATFTSDTNQIRSEFRKLKGLHNAMSAMQMPACMEMNELSMGMSDDYKIALEEGSTMIRVGSSIFGSRN